MATASIQEARAGGGHRRPLRLRVLTLLALVVGLATPAGAVTLPRTEDELVAVVRTAIEKADYATFEDLVLWTDVSPFKRRMFSAQIRHGLNRPIAKIELQHADETTRFDLQQLRGVRLNLPVTYLLRVSYGDGAGELGDPVSVFLIGKLDGVYRIALLVRSEKAQPD